MIFSNLKVVELASVLAGPSVGQFFAELGAEVIKIENKTTLGDVTRTWKSSGEATDDRSAYFCSVNWGKKSVVLDLYQTNDQACLHRILQKADIVIASYKPGDAEKLNVDYTTVSRFNPAMIYGNLTGYGKDNDRVGYDALIQAESGFMDLNGEKNGPPLKMPVALIDILAAHQLKEGLLVALLQREKSGKGSYVEVSLIQTALASLANQASNYLIAGITPSRQGSLHPNIAPYGEVFLTSDGKKILLAIGSDKQFENLLSVLHISMDSPQKTLFDNNEKRVKNREALAHLLKTSFAKRPSTELMPLLHQQKIPVGIIQTVPEAMGLPEAQALLLEQNGLRGVRTFIAHREGEKNHSLLPPPHLGEHTHEFKQE